MNETSEKVADSDRPVRLPDGTWVRPSIVGSILMLPADEKFTHLRDRVSILMAQGHAKVIECRPGQTPAELADEIAGSLGFN